MFPMLDHGWELRDFGSDRDGRDQLFAVRADGSGLARPRDARRRTRRAGIRLLQLAAAALVVLLGAIAIVPVVAKCSWPAVQLQAVAVLATTEATPVLAWAVRAVTAEPQVEETTVAGAPATLVRPGR